MSLCLFNLPGDLGPRQSCTRPNKWFSDRRSRHQLAHRLGRKTCGGNRAERVFADAAWGYTWRFGVELRHNPMSPAAPANTPGILCRILCRQTCSAVFLGRDYAGCQDCGRRLVSNVSLLEEKTNQRKALLLEGERRTSPANRRQGRESLLRLPLEAAQERGRGERIGARAALDRRLEEDRIQSQSAVKGAAFGESREVVGVGG